MDIENIKNCIKEFAEKYNFLQEIDIERVENSEFNREDYVKMHNKNFICINIKTNEIVSGKISVEVDTIDEEEWYTIDKNNYFTINILDFLEKDRLTLTEAIINECKNNKMK
jgi:hypothetical protein